MPYWCTKLILKEIDLQKPCLWSAQKYLSKQYKEEKCEENWANLGTNILSTTGPIFFKFSMYICVYKKHNISKLGTNGQNRYRDTRDWKWQLSNSCELHTCVWHVFLGYSDTQPCVLIQNFSYVCFTHALAMASYSIYFIQIIWFFTLSYLFLLHNLLFIRKKSIRKTLKGKATPKWNLLLLWQWRWYNNNFIWITHNKYIYLCELKIILYLVHKQMYWIWMKL